MKRLLCLVSSMNTGGAETFLMKLYRKIDRTKYQMDFGVNIQDSGFYDEEIKQMGGMIYYVPPKSQDIKAFRNRLAEVVGENKYEYVMRVTSNTMGFMDLKIAKEAGAKVCIARSSNSSDGGSLKSKTVHVFGGLLYSKYVDVKIAPSNLAAKYTFGEKAFENGEVYMLRNALDLNVYRYSEEKRNKIREEFGIRDKDILLGHIGRFTEQKNHKFLVQLFAKLCQKHNNYKLLLVGNGELEKNIGDLCKQLGIENKVIFAGVRSDIPDILSAIDCFLFPSLYEGMPNTVIESQATGLSCLVADTVTKECNLGIVRFLPINQGVEPWIEAIEQSNHGINRLNFNQKLVETPYDINCAVKEFIDIVFR